MTHPFAVNLYCRHWETQLPLPYPLFRSHVQRLKQDEWDYQSDKGQGKQQLLYALLDQKLHSMTPIDARDSLTNGWTQNLAASLHRTLYHSSSSTKNHPHVDFATFKHLYGYGAGYYSYLWCRRIAQCVFQQSLQGSPWMTYSDDSNSMDLHRTRTLWSKQGGLIRSNVLKWGGGLDPKSMDWTPLIGGSIMEYILK